jgi:formate hydrogenlyase transcriptional activator
VGEPLAVDESPAGHAWRNQRTLFVQVDTATEWPLVLELLRDRGIQSCCYVPLTTAQRRLGAVGFGYITPHEFTDNETGFMEIVAAQVAVAVDNALTHDDAQRERDRLALVLDVTSALASSLDARELFGRITEAVRRVIPHDYASLALIKPGERAMVIRALDIAESRGMIREGMVITDEHSPALMALERQTVVVFDDRDIATMDSEAARRLRAEGIQTAVCVPLATRNSTLGALNVGFRDKRRISESDTAVLSQIARQVAVALENAIAFRHISELKNRLAEEKVYLEDELRADRNFAEMVGESPAFRKILQQIQTVGPTGATVLILGETGTGKELVARAIHQSSDRRERTFVKLNCAAIPTGLLESELFGHEKGAFTGAIQQKVGRLELADGGTLFLDEVGDIPPELQPKLLRAIQEREFERLGSNRTLKVDVRLIAATNRDLSRMVAEREFRADLYYRLNVFPVAVPPLRDRPEDIPLLVRYFTQVLARRMNRPIESIPTATMDRLRRYSWPGNVRELENLIERAVILSPGPELRVPDPGADGPLPGAIEASTLRETERTHILRVLDDTGWVLSGDSGAAARLGMKRTTLQSRMKKLGIARQGVRLAPK